MAMRTIPITFEGKKYDVVDMGGFNYLEMQDACTVNGTVKQSLFIKRLIECVSPKIDVMELSTKQIMELGGMLQDCFLK